MKERPADPDQNATPEDIATLYSRANMEGNHYWDFSESRKEVRGQFRHRLAREEAERAQPVQARPATQAAPLDPSPREQNQASQSARTRPLPPAYLNQQVHIGPVRVPEPPVPPSAVRWFAMHSLFSPAEVAADPPPSQASPQPLPPVIAAFSLAGGVGKTCLVATLGRALSALGEHVLLADTAAYGLVPFYFGSRERKPGVIRTFSSPALNPSRGESETPVHVLSLDAEFYPGNGGEDDPLLGQLVQDGRDASRILVDIATASREVTRRLLLLGPTILVPILPDMSSLASLDTLKTFLISAAGLRGGAGEAFYLLNQFDPLSPLHLEVRQMLQQQLGDRLLPLALRRSPAVSEALAEGMTVIDYAPGSPVAEDYWNLAAWLRSFAAPAIVGYGGVRWSER